MLRFVLLALAWSLGLFALLKLPLIEQGALIPFAQAQQQAACGLVGDAARRVNVSISCTGADAIALCLGAILAFPATWGRRVIGGVIGLLVITVVNTLRIGTLGLVVERPRLFEALHLYLWPAALLLIVAGYVFVWMQRAQASGLREGRKRLAGMRLELSPEVVRFLVVGAVLVTAYVVAGPWIHANTSLLHAAHWVAATAAALLSLLGGDAAVQGNIFRTANGSYAVTQACITSPLIPIYLTAALLLPRRWIWRIIALILTPAVFFLLGVARLSVLGLPLALLQSPFSAIHAFYQALAGLILVGLAVRVAGASSWRIGIRRWGLATVLGGLAGVLLGTLALRTVQWSATALQALAGHSGHLSLDDQGALAWLPGMQVALTAGLLIALRRGTRWLRAIWAFAAMMLLTVGLFILYGELHAHLDVSIHVRWIRAWGIVGPTLLAWFAYRANAAAAGGDGDPEAQRYRSFWADVGRDFPSLSGALSTRYYFDNERRLFEDYFGDLRGKRIFKTDLWDEAKNTRILRWAAEHGAAAFGADISPPIAAQARRGFPGKGLRGVVADVRALPFRDGSFDAVYSMGTVEHFDETEKAMGETFRIVRPGGRVIMGVPNRHDPFLRPLLVALLYRLGLYGYGFEKSYSRKTLRRMLERRGFVIHDETSILFIPGWLRMLELAGHAWFKPLAWLLGWFVRPFVWADRHFPWVRRHGYLLATVADRPVEETHE